MSISRKVYFPSFYPYLTEDCPELLPHEAVDEDVDGGVDDEEDVGEEAEEDAPDGEAAQLGVLAGADGLQHCKEEGEEQSGGYDFCLTLLDYVFFF